MIKNGIANEPAIPLDWLPRVSMKRIIWHWTAGGHAPNSTDLKAYHFVIDGDGVWHRGVPIERNSGSLKSGYAAHTLNCNTDSIGVSLACMAGAREVPFDPGRAPMRRIQIESLIRGSRELHKFYGIPVDRKTFLSHAEVQPTLGIAQRQKWDYTRLPFDLSFKGALPIGDWLRKRILETGELPVAREPFPAGAQLRADRDLPSFTLEGATIVSGSVPKGTVVSLEAEGARRVQVTTPGGWLVWADASGFTAIDGPAPEQPTIPSPIRKLIAEGRAILDAIEAELEK